MNLNVNFKQAGFNKRRLKNQIDFKNISKNVLEQKKTKRF